MIVRRVFEYATRIVRSFSAGGSSVIDPQDIASPVTRRPGELEDLGLIGCVVRVAGEVVMTAAGAAVMGHPAASVAWLASQLAAEEEGLRAGQLVFSGGVTAPVPAVARGSVTFQFGGLGAIEVAGA